MNINHDDRNYLTWLRDLFTQPFGAAIYLFSIVFGGMLVSWIMFDQTPSLIGAFGCSLVALTLAFVGVYLNRRYPKVVKGE